MKLVWAPQAWDDDLHWQKNDRDVVEKINGLIENIRRDPFRGIGKPEPLKGVLQGWWSRRITGEHRFVYRVVGTGDAKALQVAQCRYHY